MNLITRITRSQPETVLWVGAVILILGVTIGTIAIEEEKIPATVIQARAS